MNVTNNLEVQEHDALKDLSMKLQRRLDNTKKDLAEVLKETHDTDVKIRLSNYLTGQLYELENTITLIEEGLGNRWK